MDTPYYADDPVYREMVSLCNAAGLTVNHRKLDFDIIAETAMDKKDISLSHEEIRFGSETHAAQVIGHELAHHLLSKIFIDIHAPDTLSESDRFILNKVTESSCDIVGAVLYILAKMIAVHKAVQESTDNSSP